MLVIVAMSRDATTAPVAVPAVETRFDTGRDGETIARSARPENACSSVPRHRLQRVLRSEE